MDTDPPRDEAELTKGKSNIDITVRMIGHSAKTKGGVETQYQRDWGGGRRSARSEGPVQVPRSGTVVCADNY